VTVGLGRGATWAPELRQSLEDVKFAVPQRRPDAVTRDDLIAAARASNCRFVAVTAPAGYGKSTFLAEWARTEDRRVGWASLDRSDDDPRALLVSLASAFCRSGLGSAELIADMRGSSASMLRRAAPRLAAQFRASPVPFVLFLDDFEELQSAATHDVVDVLMSGMPDGSQLATASRLEQPHVARLRAYGEVVEFGAGDLALDGAGAGHIFAGARVSLSAEQAAAVAVRTEGWPVGLHLAAMIASHSHGQDWTVTGDDRYVADYLYREALVGQPEDVQRFLRRTAVLDQLSGPLCDAVAGCSDAGDQLRRLEAASLFVVPLDRRREWYRYHELFREFLLGELRRSEPGAITALHQRAADWYEQAGSPELALEHLLHTTDSDRAVRLADSLMMQTFSVGQLPTLQRWLRVIGDANIERYPPLALQRCWLAMLTGETAQAERWAAFLDAASFDSAPVDGSASFESGRAMLQAARCASGPDRMMADAAFALAQEPAWSPWRGVALWTLGEANLLGGHIDEAAGLLGEASIASASTGEADTMVLCESELALIAMDRGDWAEAADRIELALATIERNRLHDYVGCLLAFAEAARLALHHGDPSEAHGELTRAMRARSSATYDLPFVAVRLRLELAKVYLALAEAATARQLLREIDDVLSHRPGLGALAGAADDFRRLLERSAESETTGRPPLTPAELRLLPYLQTHLTADRIAERLFVSSHTVKTQVKSIYRKLGVSSRNEAVQKATTIGLLGA
jgi:LuxR family transcriptional regulator, maltose regulon positive regulatory protein